jgi:hypothetical protein
MLFRRHRPREITFEERLAALRQSGFETVRQPDGRVRVSKNGCAAMISDVPGGTPRIEKAGWLIGGEIALLVDAGFQKFWRVGNVRKAPALASQLQALHEFEEDLREALGLESLYNTSLGTVNDLHQYDRLEGRDQGVAVHPWQVNEQQPLPAGL